MHHKRLGSPTNSVELRVFKLQKSKGTTAERINIFTGQTKALTTTDVLHRLTGERFAIPVPITNSGLDCR